MKYHAFRLRPGEDLREGIEKNSAGIKAGAVLTCAGSLKNAVLRLADAKEVKEFPGPFEIVSLTGTISPEGNHIHISVSDTAGAVIGGHLKKGSVVNTTAEIVIAELESCEFSREPDEETGYKELVVKKT